MHGTLDPFDPRTWAEDDHEHRIYGNDALTIYALVDPEDYTWFARWRWSPKVSKGGKKVYLFRPQSDRSRASRVVSLYLHVEIMKRTGIQPPSSLHTMTDHRNGNGLDCRRRNLRWATPRMNCLNRNGRRPHDLIEG